MSNPKTLVSFDFYTLRLDRAKGFFTGAVRTAKKGENKGLEKVYEKKEALLLDTNNIIGKTSDASVQNYIEVDSKVCVTKCFLFFTGPLTQILVVFYSSFFFL